MYSFFYGYALHSDLHSFPTRRSSDLTTIATTEWCAFSANDGTTRQCACEFATEPECPLASTAPESERSEEHTSELQSPDHLVCRPLREKKNRLARSERPECNHNTRTR